MPTPIAQSGIAAQAFRLLEMQPISSLDDDSEQAISAAEQYPEALRICLEHGEWSFARVAAQLARVDEPAGDPELGFSFQRPSDFVKMLDVWPCGVRWRLDADRLRADAAGPLHVRYTRMISDETLLGANFRTAVAARLASLLALRWTTSNNRAQALLEMSAEYLARAARADRNAASQGRYDGREREPDWVGAALAPGFSGGLR